MHRKGWYLVAYDIASLRRLVRVHRVLKREGIAVQKSVFLVFGTERAVDGLLDRLKEITSRNEDDLRAYPIREPGDLWTSGPNPLSSFPILQI